jgi:hypothetical protein
MLLILIFILLIIGVYVYVYYNNNEDVNKDKNIQKDKDKYKDIQKIPNCDDLKSSNRKRYTKCIKDKLLAIKDTDNYYIIVFNLSDNYPVEGNDTRFIISKQGDYLHYISNLPVNYPIEIIFTSDIGIFKINLKTDDKGYLYFNKDKQPLPVVLLNNTIIEINYIFEYIITDLNFIKLGLATISPIGHYSLISHMDKLKLNTNEVTKIGNKIGKISNGQIEF